MKDIRREVERRSGAGRGRAGDPPPCPPGATQAGRVDEPRSPHAALFRRSRRPGLGLAPRTRQLLSDYVELTKPKVQSLLLLTTIATMYVAGDPSVALVALTCLGGYLSAGGAGAVNHWFDRDIDARMARTATRPIPAGRIAPAAALAFGCTLAAPVVPRALADRQRAGREPLLRRASSATCSSTPSG